MQDESTHTTIVIHGSKICVRDDDAAKIVSENDNKYTGKNYSRVSKAKNQPPACFNRVVDVVIASNRTPGAADAENDCKIIEAGTGVVYAA